jgi:hypothetical protein
MPARKLTPPKTAPDLRSRILTIRGQKVILDADLAALYGVTTKRLNEQVKRNARRFPRDFYFQLTLREAEDAKHQYSVGESETADDEKTTTNRSQFATGSGRHRDPRYLPYAFTENGAIMAANVLHSPEAVRMSVFVVRAFIQMRDLLTSNSRELAAELRALEAKLTARLDGQELMILDVLRRLMDLIDPPPAPPVPEKSLGFHTALKQPPAPKS